MANADFEMQPIELSTEAAEGESRGGGPRGYGHSAGEWGTVHETLIHIVNDTTITKYSITKLKKKKQLK